ncbi:MAG: Pyrimidine-nucleoside phosphorylase [Acidobacteriota bacterium]|nr:Pyrimidine-nucleoside phosphorylase [Acidobacteriota bacterium]
MRAGEPLRRGDLSEVAQSAADGSWSDAQLAAFLMGVAIRGLDVERTRELTAGMLDSGERWNLAREWPNLLDKHSTGGVGDKASLLLAPLLAAAGAPVVMLTGRGLGHTAGTADKLEAIPGFRQELDRGRAVQLLERCGIALGIATAGIAPADRKLYALRDRTATVDSLPLIVASILSKKLATGAAAIVFDVKVGDAAFLPRLDQARELAGLLAGISSELGMKAEALLTDMNQPLGDWAGHASEIREVLDCLAGGGPRETIELTLALALALGRQIGASWSEASLRDLLASGAARERFVRWAVAQGATERWFEHPDLPLAPVEVVIQAQRSGFVAAVRTRELGLLLAEAGGARRSIGSDLDLGIALHYRTRLGRRVEAGEELARVYLRTDNQDLAGRFGGCFEIGEEGSAPDLIVERIAAA